MMIETSVYLAKVIGLFGAISTFVIIIRYKSNLVMEENAARDPASIYLSGFLFLMLGVLLTVSHPVWVWDWRLVITILGWLVLFKGLMRILYPEKVKQLIEKKKTDRRFLLGEVVTFLISVYLIYQGFVAN